MRNTSAMGRSPTGPEDMVALIAIIAFMHTMSASYATGRQNQYGNIIAVFARCCGPHRSNRLYPVFATLSLFFKGYLTFAYFYFVRSDRLAFSDGTKFWETIHHQYFRVSVAFICTVCANNLADRLYFQFYQRAVSLIVYFGILGLTAWQFAEMCTVNRDVTHDHIYLWVGAGLWTLQNLAVFIAVATGTKHQTGFEDDSDYGLIPLG